MNARKAKIIFFKEMLETLRDKRTLFVMILGPVLIYPVMIIVMGQMSVFQQTKMEQRAEVIEVSGGDNAPELVAMIEADKQMQVLPVKVAPEGPPVNEITSGADLRLIIRKGVGPARPRDGDSQAEKQTAVDTKKLIRVIVVYDDADFFSRHARDDLERVLHAYSREMISRDIAVIDEHETFEYPMIRSQLDISTPVQRGGDLLGGILPMILIMMTIAGAMYPAIDTTAGEKERGTIETILTVPARMSEIVVGKFMSVFLISSATGFLNLLGMAATFGWFLAVPHSGIDLTIPAVTFVLILVFLIPLAFLFGALMMAVATYARTFKEAQSYVSIMYIVSIFPAMLSTMQGTELGGFLLVAPVVNLTLLFKELMRQEFVLSHILVTFASSSAYAGLALWLTVRMFHKESVLFSSERPFSLFVRRSLLRPKDLPSPSEALFLIAVMLVLILSAGLAAQSWNMIAGLIIMQVGLILAPAVLFAKYLKVNMKETFNLRLPSFAHVVAALLMGIGAVFLASVIDGIQKYFYNPVNQEAERQMQDFIVQLPVSLRLTLIAFLPAVCEETFFRGFVLSGFRNGMRAWKAIVLTGVFFGFAHVVQVLVRVVPVAHIFLGIMLAYLVYRSRSILCGMIFHFVFNGAVVISAVGEGEMSLPTMILLIFSFLAGLALSLFPSNTGTFDSEAPSDIIARNQ